MIEGTKLHDAVSAGLDRMIEECGATTPEQCVHVLLNVVSAVVAAVHVGQGEAAALDLLDTLRVGVVAAEADDVASGSRTMQ